MKVSFPTSPQPIADASNDPPSRSGEVKAAREFEQIFLRKMLSSLEKTSRIGEKGSVSGGSDVYSSMVVNALADAIASAGGIGLADMVVQRLGTEPVNNSAPNVSNHDAARPQPRLRNL